MKRLIPVPLCFFLLTACNVELPPIESCLIADASAAVDGPDKTELAPTHLKPLSEWFAAQSSGWNYKVTDNPPEGTVLVIKHRGGRITRVNLRGNEMWVGNRFKVLSPAERAEILAIIAQKNQLPVFGR